MRASYACVLFLVCLLATALEFGRAQQDAGPANASLCELYQHPAIYTGKTVTVRGSVAGSDLWIDDFETTCSSWFKVIIVLPKDAQPPQQLQVVRDESFNAFFDGLRKGMNVQATFEGRFEAGSAGGLKGHGFGRKHDARAQIVLLRVSDVVARPRPRK
jgi:hypothetical protein